MNYVHSAASIAHKEVKSQDERKEERSYYNQSKSRTDSRGCSLPRRKKTLYVQDATANFMYFNTTSGPILRCRGWTLAGAPCTLIKACQNGVIIPGGMQNTNRTEGGNSASGSGGNRKHFQDETMASSKSTSFKRLDSPGLSKRWLQIQLGHRNSLLSGNFSINSVSTFNINNSSWRRRRRILGKCFPNDTTDPLVGPVEHGPRERIGLVCNLCSQSNIESEPESVNHQQTRVAMTDSIVKRRMSQC